MTPFMSGLCPRGGGGRCDHVSVLTLWGNHDRLLPPCFGEQRVLESVTSSDFQKNLEFLHTDEIIRWHNYAGSFVHRGSSDRKVIYGIRQGQVENQEDASFSVS